MVETPHSHCRGHRFYPGSILHAVWCSQKKDLFQKKRVDLNLPRRDEKRKLARAVLTPLAGHALLHCGMVWTGGRGWGQANGEIAAMQEQTATRNPLTPGPELLSTGTGRVGK